MKNVIAATPLLDALVAFSRLYLYVHFLNDIPGATVLGILIAEVTFRCCGRLLNQCRLPYLNRL